MSLGQWVLCMINLVMVEITVFNVVDDFNRKGLTIEADFLLPAIRVIGVLDKISEWRGNPKSIRRVNYRVKRLDETLLIPLKW